MIFPINASIWMYPEPIDFRKQIDSLVILVASHLELDPVSGQLFLFRDRSMRKIKILWWERTGFWLMYKRLEKGRFKFPKDRQGKIEITADQLSWLLSGLDCFEHHLLPEIKSSNYY